MTAAGPSDACVDVWVGSKRGADGDVKFNSTSTLVPSGGLKVNLLVGQTGAGKTSLIQMSAGGGTTTTAGAGDTKKPFLYLLSVSPRKSAYILDTQGLVDPGSDAKERARGVKNLVRFIQEKNLEVCKVYFAVFRGQRSMQELVDWTPTLLVALGGCDKVKLISNWVITQWNQDSANNRRLCTNDEGSQTGTTAMLRQCNLQLEITHHGFHNKDGFLASLVRTDAQCAGLMQGEMSTDVRPLATKKEDRDAAETAVGEITATLKKMNMDEHYEREQAHLQEQLDQAHVDLANSGGCGGTDPETFKRLIREFKAELEVCSKAWRDNGISREKKEQQRRDLNQAFQQKIAELDKHEHMMGWFSSFIGGAKVCADVFNIRSGK